jgi:hypothetical protein
MVLSVIDKRLPYEAKENLSRYFDVLEFSTNGITYKAISGHTDIFFCKIKNGLILSPNVPEKYSSVLNKRNIKYEYGSTFSQMNYPQSAAYCAVIDEHYLIHRADITDEVILRSAGNHELISVQQGYTRCNLLSLKDNSFITSDDGIYRNLCNMSFNGLYVDPSDILLPGFRHGFFGGACGVYEDMVFVAGSLDFFRNGKAVREFLGTLKYKIVELYNGPLFDCGSILFI